MTYQDQIHWKMTKRYPDCIIFQQELNENIRPGKCDEYLYARPQLSMESLLEKISCRSYGCVTGELINKSSGKFVICAPWGRIQERVSRSVRGIQRSVLCIVLMNWLCRKINRFWIFTFGKNDLFLKITSYLTKNLNILAPQEEVTECLCIHHFVGWIEWFSIQQFSRNEFGNLIYDVDILKYRRGHKWDEKNLQVRFLGGLLWKILFLNIVQE